ncbi:hypothetical protein L1049_020205 [Liquidambar formosana]|uniref:Uncharacterized GPI-anchored protein At5g19230-like domain-containing protein n=1 Tax=Liquidambar formosana TaxID=63359 RepID=A0AAP0X5U2_LIQFO
MASLRLLFSSFLLVHAILLLSNTVNCNEDEDKLLQGLNSYRTARNLPILKEHDNADCIADEVAQQLEDQPCTRPIGPSTAVPGTGPQFANYPDALKKCKIHANTTRDGVILPACVPKLVSTLVLANYTETQYARYLNDSKYTGIGIGSEDDWIVVVLTTNTPTGSFASAAACLVFKVGLDHYYLFLLLGLFLLLTN